MAKMKKTYSYEWYGPCVYEEKEDIKKALEEAPDNNAFTSRVIPFERGFGVSSATLLESR